MIKTLLLRKKRVESTLKKRLGQRSEGQKKIIKLVEKLIYEDLSVGCFEAHLRTNEFNKKFNMVLQILTVIRIKIHCERQTTCSAVQMATVQHDKKDIIQQYDTFKEE